MQRTLFVLALVCALAACQKAEIQPSADAAAVAGSPAPAAQADAAFADLSARALAGWLRISPVSATQIGEHRYDSEIDDLSAKGRRQSLDFSRTMLAELDRIDAVLFIAPYVYIYLTIKAAVG